MSVVLRAAVATALLPAVAGSRSLATRSRRWALFVVCTLGNASSLKMRSQFWARKTGSVLYATYYYGPDSNTGASFRLKFLDFGRAVMCQNWRRLAATNTGPSSGSRHAHCKQSECQGGFKLLRTFHDRAHPIEITSVVYLRFVYM